MADRRAKVCVDVEVEFQAGRLPWTYDAVKSLIRPYPKRGHLDTVKDFQEDVCELEEGEIPWLEDEPPLDPLAEEEADENLRGHGDTPKPFD